MMHPCEEFKPLWDLVPKEMRGDVGSYVRFGFRPSTFLYYILTHKFYVAYHFEDAKGKNDFGNWFKFLKYSMPIDAHGSDEKVLLWQSGGGLTGRIK